MPWLSHTSVFNLSLLHRVSSLGTVRVNVSAGMMAGQPAALQGQHTGFVQNQTWALWGGSLGYRGRELGGVVLLGFPATLLTHLAVCAPGTREGSSYKNSGTDCKLEGLSYQQENRLFCLHSPSRQIRAVLNAGLSYFSLRFTHISNKQGWQKHAIYCNTQCW